MLETLFGRYTVPDRALFRKQFAGMEDKLPIALAFDRDEKFVT